MAVKQEAFRRLDPDALSVFCRQLALLLHSGIGAEEAAAILADDADAGETKALFAALHRALSGGAPLSQAMEDCGVFPVYLLRMVEIGQTAGRLDQVLDALSAYYRREAALSAAVRRAVFYPAAMAILVALVFFLLVTRVLPAFQQVFAQLGMTLSPAARVLFQLGNAGERVGIVLTAGLAAAAVVLLVLSRRTDSLLQSLPMGKGAIGTAVNRSRLAASLSLMLSSGLPLDEAMERTEALLEGTPLSQALFQCRRDTEAGTDFPQAVLRSGLFSGMDAGLLAAGFRSGSSGQAMEELARRCEAAATDRLEGRLEKLEFALVLLLCAAVGLVLLSVMLPLLGVLTAIG